MKKLSLSGDWQRFVDQKPELYAPIYFWSRGIFAQGYLGNSGIVYLNGNSTFGSLAANDLQGIKQIPEESYWVAHSKCDILIES